jgi:hypothetical protein
MRLRLLTLTLLTFAAAGHSAQAVCPILFWVDAQPTPGSGALVQWTSAQPSGETHAAYGGLTSGKFFIGFGLESQRVGLQLPGVVEGRDHLLVRARFIGENSVNSEQWQDLAGFTWSIWTDISGSPGTPLCDEVEVPLAEDPQGYQGQWFETLVPCSLSSASTALWLIGRWPDDAVPVVRLSSANANGLIPTVAGFESQPGVPEWQALSNYQLAVEATFLTHAFNCESGSGLSRLPVTPSPAFASTLSYEVLRRVVLSTPSAEVLTELGPFSDLNCLEDTSCPVGVNVSYGITPIGSDPCPQVWTGTFTLAAANNVDVSPISIDQAVNPLDIEPIVVLVFNHHLTDTMKVCTDPATVLSPDVSLRRYAEEGLTLSAQTTEVLIPPAHWQSLTFSPVVGAGGPLGWFAGTVPLTVESMSTGSRDVHLIHMHLQVDISLDVADGSTQSAPDRQRLRVSPSSGSNDGDFAVRIDIAPLSTGASTEPAVSDCLGRCDRIEIVIVNALGQICSQRSIDGYEGLSASLTIPGSRSWPSGVYFCRVNWAGQVAATKLMRLK